MLAVTAPRAGERITVTFPLPETVTDESAAGRVYRVRWRGDDVIGIEPEGRIRPMYPTRTPAPQAPLREHTLHVPAEEWSW
jgi:hypothetical protein